MNFDDVIRQSSPANSRSGIRRTRTGSFTAKRRSVTLSLSRAHIFLVPLTILTILTIQLIYKAIPRSVCAQVNDAYSAIASTTATLGVSSVHVDREIENDANVDMATWLTRQEQLRVLLRRLRRHSARLLELRQRYLWCKLGSKRIRLGSRLASRLEFSITARVAIDGVMLYLLSVSGTGRGTFVEIDATHGDKIISSLFASCYAYGTLSSDAERSASLFLFHETWTGYASACQVYSGVRDINVGVIDAGRLLMNYPKLFGGQMIAGDIDVAGLFSGQGDELLLLSTFLNESLSPMSAKNAKQQESWIRPRFVILKYQDYWGLSHRWRTSNESSKTSNGERDSSLVGGSLPAVLKFAHAASYRLVWCLASAPIVVLGDARISAGIPADILPTLSARECLQLRDSDTWRKDAERLWDDAQNYQWHSE